MLMEELSVIDAPSDGDFLISMAAGMTVVVVATAVVILAFGC